MLHEQIKQATAQHHKDAEQHSYGREIMSKTLTRDQYTQLLIANYTYIKAWESEWDSLPFEIPTSLQLDARKKVDLLENDLRHLNIEPSSVRAFDLTPAQSYEEFMGRMYVIEGSTLGGAVIEKQLRLNPNLEGAQFAFYGGYGKELIPHWKAFLAELNNITETGQMEVAIESAKSCFRAVESCFKMAKQQPLS
jgi:heme oxygenase